MKFVVDEVTSPFCRESWGLVTSSTTYLGVHGTVLRLTVFHDAPSASSQRLANHGTTHVTTPQPIGSQNRRNLRRFARSDRLRLLRCTNTPTPKLGCLRPRLLGTRYPSTSWTLNPRTSNYCDLRWGSRPQAKKILAPTASLSATAGRVRVLGSQAICNALA
jgi:hypothetical protein